MEDAMSSRYLRLGLLVLLAVAPAVLTCLTPDRDPASADDACAVIRAL
jgi:hypothetical protein